MWDRVMKTRFKVSVNSREFLSLDRGRSGFGRVELLVMVLMCMILVIPLLLSAMTRNNARSKRIGCAHNLKDLGLAFKTWALDHGDGFPMSAVRQPSLATDSKSAQAFRCFQVMSNEMADTRILICPADTRHPASDLGSGFSNRNLSYFVGLDAVDTNPSMFLLGDRNLTNGPLSTNRILIPNTNFPVGWSREMHGGQGNIALADGSVQQYSSKRLGEALRNGYGTNRLAFP
jgi:prepilin-type processing-associated H-X9-DG protein